MTQDQILLLLLKFGLISGVASLLLWIIVYTRLQPWWHDQIGITLVAKSSIVIGQLIFLALALFFHLNRFDNRVVGWAYTIFTLAITPIMIWRTIVWIRASRRQAENDLTITPDDQEVGSGASP